MFNPGFEFGAIMSWVKRYLEDSPSAPLVIGISGGKDSAITAAALVEAVGSHRILGVLMPNGYQTDIDVAREVCEFLKISSIEVNINTSMNALFSAIKASSPDRWFSDNFNFVVNTNAPARMRMGALYIIANQIHGRVVNTCNMSESFVGYDTKFGDQCGDFGLFQEYTCSEVKEIGRILGVPDKFVDKAPDDGMCGVSDENRWGFTYDFLDHWIRTGGGCTNDKEAKILMMHIKALHKLEAVRIPHPCYARVPEESHLLHMSESAAKDLLVPYVAKRKG